MIANFSVLMPVYIKENADFLTQSIESLLEQTVLPGEIVIVKDGPLTKDLDLAIEHYQAKYPHLFQVISLSENMGMGAAMDAGLRACKYDWVARMDSDDIARPYRFEKQMKHVQKHQEIDVLGSYIEEFNCHPGDLGQIRKLPVEHAAIEQFSKSRCPINHMTVLYKKSKAIEAGSYWHERSFEDYHLWYQMLKRGCIFHNLPEILVDARIGNDMISRRHGWNYFKKEYYFFLLLKKDAYISNIKFLRNISERFIARHVPVRVLKFLYKKLLR